jgi:hypothetical protein
MPARDDGVGPPGRRPTAAAAHITAQRATARAAGCRVIRTKVAVIEVVFVDSILISFVPMVVCG